MSIFVLRDTNYPAEDLKRNWSAFAGGSCNGEEGGVTADEARENFANQIGVDCSDVENEFKFHPAYNEFVAVDYEGLGAFELEAETLEEAIEEAKAEYTQSESLACCVESGSGHFYAEDCISFHKLSDSRYIFEVSELA